MARLIGYARISTDTQKLDLQIDALRHAGCEQIYQDVMSGSIKHRPGLDLMMKEVTSGDVVCIYKLDRIGRSLSNLVHLVEDMSRREINLRVLTGGIDTSTKEGRMMFGIMGSLAEYERALIRERVAAGLAAAKRRGVRLGPKDKITPAKMEALKTMARAGMMQKEIARALEVSRSTLWRTLKELE